MKIKRYEAVNMQDAVRLIKDDLGPDAVILSTKNIKKDRFGFGLFSRQWIEVTAAIDEKTTNSLRQRKANVLHGLSRRDLELDPLKRDLEEMKDILHSLSIKRDGCASVMECQRVKEEFNHFSRTVCSLLQQKDIYSQSLMGLYKKLIFNGIDEKLAAELIAEVNRICPKSKLEDNDYLTASLAKIMMEMVRVSGSLKLEKGGQSIVVLVGPTGVGKTTTIAKMASLYSMLKKKRVGLVTIDTYRIGAIEQLKTYAKIIGIDVDVILNIKDFGNYINRNQDKDLILVDTVGRSHLDPSQINELKTFFNGEISVETHLALNVTTKDKDLVNIIDKFSEIRIDKLLFTKLDESTTFGSIFNHSVNTKIPLSYLTTGQKVPEDIEIAVPERIVDLILHISRN